MQLQIFKYQSDEENMLNDVRTLEINDEIWFVAIDVCKALGIGNSREAIKRVDDDDVSKADIVDFAGRKQPNTNIINESGLYALVFQSKKEGAKKFKKWVTKEVIPSIRKKGFYGRIDRAQLPNFITRYKDNYHKIDRSYFSVISEMFVRLYMELEKVGYQIPDKAIDGKQMIPDISVGLGFAAYLKANESHFYNTHKSYMHSFPDGREVRANMYDNKALPLFIQYINEKWIPENAEKYFKTRDPAALDYLPKILGDVKKK